MKHKIAICAGLMALGRCRRRTSAQARGYGEPPPAMAGRRPQMIQEVLPPAEMLMLVRAHGLAAADTAGAPRRRAMCCWPPINMGGQLRVVVSAYNGRMLHVSPPTIRALPMSRRARAGHSSPMGPAAACGQAAAATYAAPPAAASRRGAAAARRAPRHDAGAAACAEGAPKNATARKRAGCRD